MSIQLPAQLSDKARARIEAAISKAELEYARGDLDEKRDGLFQFLYDRFQFGAAMRQESLALTYLVDVFYATVSEIVRIGISTADLRKEIENTRASLLADVFELKWPADSDTREFGRQYFDDRARPALEKCEGWQNLQQLLLMQAEDEASETSYSGALAKNLAKDTEAATGTRLRINQFLAEASSVASRDITRTELWKSAGYSNRTPFEQFQREDPDTSVSARKAFERILSMAPAAFVASLKS